MRAVLVLGIILLIGWFIFQPFKSSEYTGYFYYDMADNDNYWSQSGLKDIDACRSWINSQIPRDYDGRYDYECGKNCTYREDYKSVVCKTTER